MCYYSHVSLMLFSVGSKTLMVNLSQAPENKCDNLTVSPTGSTFTESVLVGENVSTNIQSWWTGQMELMNTIDENYED